MSRASEGTQTALEEVVVTARRREEPPQAVPLSLAVIGGDEIDAAGAYTFVRLQQLDPALHVVSFNPRQTSISIRGLGGNVGFANDGLEGGVGVFLDQVYLGRPGAAMFELVDLERIEILHGPQGTLFGRNTTAGAISMVTKPPRFDGSDTIVEASVGDYGFHQVKTSISGPLRANVLAGRISIADTGRDGFLENVSTGKRVQDYDNLMVRGQLLIAPTSTVDIRLIGDYARQEQRCCTVVGVGALTQLDNGSPFPNNFFDRSARLGYTPLPFAPFDRKVDADWPLHADMDQHGFSAQVDWSLAGARLTSISAYRAWDWAPSNDGDDTPLPVFTAFRVENAQEQVSQELRIASSGERRIDYVAGLYHFRETVDGITSVAYGAAAPAWFFAAPSAIQNVALNGFGTVATSSPETRSDALFGTGIWHLTPALDLSAGLRFTHERRQGGLDQRQVAGPSVVSLSAADAAAARAIRNSFAAEMAYFAEVEDDSLSGDFTLSYRTQGAMLGYFTVAHGHKSGGLSIGSLPAGIDPAVDPETTDHLELGLKGDLFDGSVVFSAALYESTISDYQTSVVQPDAASGRLLQYISNIDDVRSKGGELDVAWSPGDRYSLTASIAHVDAEYESYPNGPCPLEVSVAAARCDLSGQPLAGAPERSWSLALDGRRPWFGVAEIYWRLDYSHQSSMFTAVSDSRYSRVEAYGVANVRLGLRRADRRWDFALWVRNMLDEDYFQQSAVRSTGWIAATPGDPRTLGFTFRGQY